MPRVPVFVLDSQRPNFRPGPSKSMTVVARLSPELSRPLYGARQYSVDCIVTNTDQHEATKEADGAITDKHDANTADTWTIIKQEISLKKIYGVDCGRCL
ncbi:hypothetical protein DPMN_108731 [Dreissena polymorpha]|uniref:Uncharacterized protein n=1 Tax=Dreissena polymorpha TaxID=45954 RepID=A0A9D4K916_DREPO|nr:hypothetical protein DPMN_108731 [Dreissena polymorpha]